MTVEIKKIEKLRADIDARRSTWKYGQTIYQTGTQDALNFAYQLVDDLLYEANGGTYEEDPEPWVYRDGTRQSYGPGHDSVYGWSEYRPRKIRPEVAESPGVE